MKANIYVYTDNGKGKTTAGLGLALRADGNLVLYKTFSGSETEFEGKKYLLIQYSEILAKIVKTGEI